LTPKDPYSGRTAPLTSKRCILYIYSTKTGTEYFKHGIHCPFFSLQNAVCFIILMYLVPVLFTFYIQGVLKLKKNNSTILSIVKPTRCINVSNLFYFGMTLYTFRTVFPSIVRSSRLCICLLLYAQSWTPDDGREDRPKRVECHSKIK